MEKLARALLGAGSGGVLGLLVSGLLGLGKPGAGALSLAILIGITMGTAVLVALLNLRQPPPAKPTAPRAAFSVVATASALLITLAVFLFQSAHIHALNSTGARVELPLSTWPISRAALLVSLAATGIGIMAAFLGWLEMAQDRERYGGSRMIAMAFLAAAAWAGLAFACYISGCGFVLSA